MRWKRWQTTFTARQSERNSSRCTAKCTAFNFDFDSVFYAGACQPTDGGVRALPFGQLTCAGAFHVNRCHFYLLLIFGVLCACDVMIFELCVAGFVCSGEGHSKMLPMSEYIDSMRANSVCSTSIDCGVMNNDKIWKGHSASYLRSGFGETRVATMLSLRTHIVRFHFPRNQSEWHPHDD